MIGNYKIAVVVPYFGKLPNYFDAWLKSVEKNPEIDWIIVTDCEKPRVMQNNIKWISKSFCALRNGVQTLFDFEISLNSPYKLCDYKPAYGHIFASILKVYDFWGFCDVDMVFGRVPNFITPEILSENEKIMKHGHFTLVKNTERMNKMYRQSINDMFPYKVVYQSNLAFYFDEGGRFGFPEICNRHDVKVYYKRLFADAIISKKDIDFLFGSGDDQKLYRDSICFWDKGKLFALTKDKEKVELLYLHLQKRIMQMEELQGNSFYIDGYGISNSHGLSHRHHWFDFYRHYLEIRLKGIKTKTEMRKFLKSNGILKEWKSYV